jgi:hypothetical protein
VRGVKEGSNLSANRGRLSLAYQRITLLSRTPPREQHARAERYWLVLPSMITRLLRRCVGLPSSLMLAPMS